jgi:hypothetical protein
MIRAQRWARAALGAILASTGITSSVQARAQDVAPVSRVEIDGDLRGYYDGERVAAYVIGGMGAAAAAGGGFLVTRGDDLARGLGWSWLVMGGLEAVGAVFYGFQVGSEIDRYDAALARDPFSYRSEEIDHLRGTSSRFVFYRAAELSLAVAGGAAATYGLASHRGAFTGAGVGVASLALPFFVIDSVNDARASRYLDEVRRFQPAVGFQPTATEGRAGAGRGWLLTAAARF